MISSYTKLEVAMAVVETEIRTKAAEQEGTKEEKSETSTYTLNNSVCCDVSLVIVVSLTKHFSYSS
jgi:hypothetical protein